MSNKYITKISIIENPKALKQFITEDVERELEVYITTDGVTRPLGFVRGVVRSEPMELIYDEDRGWIGDWRDEYWELPF